MDPRLLEVVQRLGLQVVKGHGADASARRRELAQPLLLAHRRGIHPAEVGGRLGVQPPHLLDIDLP